jgi:lipopolysaccharide transport system permease protein
MSRDLGEKGESQRPGMTLDNLENASSPVSGWRELVARRELLWTLTLREIRVRYTQAALGIAWAVLQPLSLMVVFTVFFSFFLRIPSDGVPYPLFAYVALLPWSFFATALSSAIPSLTNNASLVTKVYFPREVLPLASILAATVDFAVAAVAFLGLLCYYRVGVTSNLLFVPAIFALQLTLTLGVALLFSALNVRYRDVRHALPLVIQIWMFVTPIIYPVSVVPERFRFLYLANPMAGIVDSYRKTVLHGVPPDWSALGVGACVAVFLVVFAWRYFRRAARTFADII